MVHTETLQAALLRVFLIINLMGSELAQPRTDIAGWYTRAFGNFLCREPVGAALQGLDDAIRKAKQAIRLITGLILTLNPVAAGHLSNLR